MSIDPAHETRNTACFVIAPIGEVDSELRRRSDQLLTYIVKPAALECGLIAIRADEISEPGIITTQVIQHIIDDAMVVADLTGRNPNVFYELAVRHALRKPYVQLIQRGERIPFDVAGVRTIEIDHRDLDSVDSAKRDIARQMKAALNSRPELVDSPISVAIDLERLKRSDNPEARQLLDVVAGLSDLRAAISSIDSKLQDPSALLPPNYLRSIVASLPSREPFVAIRHLSDLRAITERLLNVEDQEVVSSSQEQFRRLLSGLSTVLSRLQSDYAMNDPQTQRGGGKD